ncbi:MAG TPA: sigma-70 family RNA polymerase sigma factor [Pedobacter sp.]|nr:sigma-70 family RNA polymerase sigma factor [Pedobacter sp.]
MTPILMLDKQGKDREEMFLNLYLESFPGVVRYISRMGGTFEEARDVFQDALVVYYEKVQLQGKVLTSGREAYLFGIARYLWNKKYHKNRLFEQLPGDYEKVTDAADSSSQEISSHRLLQLLSDAGEKCMQLLSAFYYEKMDMDALAKRFGFSGPRSATVQKFKCLEKVKKTVKEKSLKYEDILE